MSGLLLWAWWAQRHGRIVRFTRRSFSSPAAIETFYGSLNQPYMWFGYEPDRR